jgi:cytochrome o ubiquinol oxidase subunit II
MKNKFLNVFFIILLFDLIFVIAVLLKNLNAPLFNPKGIVASKEFDLLVFAVLLMLSVIIPVVVAAFFIALKYRETDENSSFFINESSESGPNKSLALLWWIIPSIIVVILAFVTWQKTHELDPHLPLSSNVKPITIQVVSLQWKWLFIYPEQKIATVNFLQFPAHTPISFQLTSDAPMNSFWIPQLGGQIYTMTGMSTKHHLIANREGEFAGSSAEISGIGFAGMRFNAKATSDDDFANWILSVKKSPKGLDFTEYESLAKPSENNPQAYYNLLDEDLYNKIIYKFMPSTTDRMQHVMH